MEERHFQEDDVVRDHTFNIVGYTLKDSALYLLASLIAFPLLFIPVINILIQTVLWNYLVKDTMSYDAASLVYEKVDTQKIKAQWKGLGIISFVSILFNLVPILNFFGPFFGEISMFHYLKSLKKNK